MHQVAYVLAGFLLIALAMRKPDWAVFATAATLPLTQSLPPTGIPGFNPINILLLSLGSGLLAGRFGPVRVRASFPARIPLLLFSAVALLGWVNSAFLENVPTITGLRFTPYNSLLTLKEIWTSGFLVLVSFWAARTVSEIRRQLWLIAAGMSLEVAYCVLEGLRSQERILGHVGQSNSLAAFLALAGATNLAIFTTTPTWTRWFFLGVAGGAALACLHTGSRGGLLALLVSFLMISILRSRWIFFLLVLLGLSSRLWLPDVILERIDRAYVVNRTGQIEAADTAEQRLEIWHAAGKMIAEHPLGVGLGAFSHYAAQYGTAAALHEPNKSAHNAFVGITAELSPLGLLLFLWLLAALARAAFRCYVIGRSTGVAPVGFTAMAALLSMLVANQTGEFFFQSFAVGHLWLILGLACKGEQLSREAAPSPGNKPGHATAPAIRRS